ncbi:MAG: hypothetical protein AB1668_05385 [Nanoarchaeota archaeon]
MKNRSSDEDEIDEAIDEEEAEEGFMEGYSEDEEVEECVECGSAIDQETKVTRKIDGEDYVFCSKSCADEFEESMGPSPE